MMYLLISVLLTAAFAGISFNKENKKSVMWFSAAMLILMCVINYFSMPVLNLWGYYGLWVEILFVTLCGAILGCMVNGTWGLEWDGEGRTWRFYIPLGVLVFMIGAGIFSSAAFHSDSYNNMLKVDEVNFEQFSSDVDVIPVDKMIVTDHDLARKVVEDRLEEDPGLGSRCVVGDMTMQQLTGSFTIDGGRKLEFDNDVIWVAPLEHSGFWKWVNNDVTPGYMLVFANDPTKTYKITEINGQPLKLRYIESGCFGDDIERKIRKSGYATQGITDFNFEIDENGRPYWVLCNHRPTIGFGARDAKGVITVDCQSGDVKQYTIDEAPNWIDHIQPEEFVSRQIKWWGELKHGWWNSLFAQRDVQEPTPGMVLVYSEGKCFWYTGVQSSGSDGATSGFMLIDARNKQTRYYKVSGVNEQEASRIVEDQNFAKAAHYSATSPVLYNVRGVPTYFMTLKGESGNVTGYAFMAVTNRQAVGVGKSKREAETNYLQAMKRTGNDSIADGSVKLEVKKLTVRDITNEQDTYYVLFVEVPGKEFTGSSEFFRELKWTKPGDQVEVTYGEGLSDVIPLDTFDNIGFTF